MKMLIGGKKADASDGKTIDIINPATHQVIDTVPSATQEDVEQVITNARDGFKVWSRVPLWKRIDILTDCINAMDAHRQELGDLIVADLGVPVSQVQGELTTAIARARAGTESARTLGGETFPVSNCESTESDLIMTIREPLGVVLAIIPFNFPLGTFSTKIWPALLMGNSVIIKPPSDDPLAILRLTEIMLECGVPGNALQAITGKGAVLGKYLNTDSRINAISMTGSTAVGADIASLAGKNLSLCALELGGNDPLIVMPDVDIDHAVEEAVINKINRSGQICHSSKRFVVHNSIKAEFMEKLAAILESKKVGDPTDPETAFGPLVHERAAKQVEEQIRANVEQGAKIVTGGHRFDETYVEPTVLDAPRTADAARDMEIFGPVWTVIGYDDLDEAIEIANDTMYGLSSGVVGKDMKAMMKVAREIQAGTCVINGGGSYTSPYAPFGGYKKSGIGRQSSAENLKEFSQIKNIVFKKLF